MGIVWDFLWLFLDKLNRSSFVSINFVNDKNKRKLREKRGEKACVYMPRDRVQAGIASFRNSHK